MDKKEIFSLSITVYVLDGLVLLMLAYKLGCLVGSINNFANSVLTMQVYFRLFIVYIYIFFFYNKYISFYLATI